jgi:hypothetical protein
VVFWVTANTVCLCGGVCVTEYKQRISHGNRHFRNETQMVSETVSFLILLISLHNCSKTIGGVNVLNIKLYVGSFMRYVGFVYRMNISYLHL